MQIFLWDTRECSCNLHYEIVVQSLYFSCKLYAQDFYQLYIKNKYLLQSLFCLNCLNCQLHIQVSEAYYITSSIYCILIKPKWILSMYMKQNL